MNPEPSTAPLLELEGVHRYHGRTPILQDVSMTVAAKSLVALTGNNGSGKTTLLRLAATLTRPERGTVHVAGHLVARHPEPARHHIAFVGDRAPLYDELTPLEHVQWMQQLHGRRFDRNAALDLLAEAGLARHLMRPCRTLSRGQRQRTALASALASGAPLLLLDEPFTALDGQGIAWLHDRLARHRDGGGSCLAAVHDPHISRGAGHWDRVLRVERRRVVEVERT